MRKPILIFCVVLFLLTACKTVKEPSDENFKKAINQYLDTHGKACASVGRGFPVDVPDSVLNDEYGTGPQMVALQRADLVRSSDIMMGSVGALGAGATQRAKRYVVTDEGKRYFQEIPGIFGKTGSFCYGDKVVDSILNRPDPITPAPPVRAEVTYTYKIVNLAPWAERPDMQHVFGDIRTTIGGVSKTHQVAGLQLTDQGWIVPEQR